MKNRIKAYKKLNEQEGNWDIYFRRHYKFGGTYDARVHGYIDIKEAELIVKALNAYKPEEYKNVKARR